MRLLSLQTACLAAGQSAAGQCAGVMLGTPAAGPVQYRLHVRPAVLLYTGGASPYSLQVEAGLWSPGGGGEGRSCVSLAIRSHPSQTPMEIHSRYNWLYLMTWAH